MDTKEAASLVAELHAEIYRLTYRRRDPREPRVSREAVAMLEHLRDSGPLTVTEAARHFDRSQAAISERLERLIGRGLVERIPDRRDRRRRLVWLTEKGEDTFRLEHEVLSSELLGAATQRMDPADIQALIKGMRALVEAAKTLARGPGKDT